MNKSRIPYIDTTKGILILCLLYGHYKQFAYSCGFDDIVLKGTNATQGLYVCFFMQTFFILTGYCSSFDIKFSSFLWKNIKTLILPALCLTLVGNFVISFQGEGSWYETFFDSVTMLYQWLIVGGPWFIIALFWAKILLWGISKITPPLTYTYFSDNHRITLYDRFNIT